MNVKFSGLIMVLALFYALACIQIAGAELVAYWPLDDGQGNEISDATENGHDGTFNGDPEWVDGVYGKALAFDGDDFVEVASVADVKPESITMATWVFFDDVSGRRDFVSRNDDYALSLGGNPQDGKLWAVITTGGDWLDVEGGTKVEVNKWYHVALTYDSGDNKLTLYLDGNKDGEDVALAGMDHRMGGALTIGTYEDRYLKGKLDDIKIWDEALSAEQINEAMQFAPVEPKDKLSLTWGKVKISQ